MDINSEMNIDSTNPTGAQTAAAVPSDVVQTDPAIQDQITAPAPLLDQHAMTAPPAVVEVASTEQPAKLISLYASFNGTIIAVLLGLGIIIGVQVVVSRIFSGARSMSDSLTTFATSMVAILVGIYCCDMLIAGPDTALLGPGERTTIVTFIKDISLMCFSYYFGSKTSGVSTTPES